MASVAGITILNSVAYLLFLESRCLLKDSGNFSDQISLIRVCTLQVMLLYKTRYRNRRKDSLRGIRVQFCIAACRMLLYFNVGLRAALTEQNVQYLKIISFLLPLKILTDP